MDPQAKALLQQMEDSPAVETLSATEARVMSKARRPQPTNVEPVADVTDRHIDAWSSELPVRLYRPAEPAGTPSPAVVYFHGGGWVVGDLDTHDAACRSACNGLGAVIVSVDYRLAPEYPWPAAADDALAALDWVHGHTGELGVDRQRLVVAGDSAGGNLAAVTALATRDRGVPVLAAQILVYPVIAPDFTTASYRENGEGEYSLTTTAMRWYWEQYDPGLRHADDPHLVPSRARSLAGVAPAFVITAEYDPLRDEGEDYAAALNAARVPVWCRRAPGMFHGFFPIMQGLDVATATRAELWGAARQLLGTVPQGGVASPSDGHR
jgi:acetyl esterase